MGSALTIVPRQQPIIRLTKMLACLEDSAIARAIIPQTAQVKIPFTNLVFPVHKIAQDVLIVPLIAPSVQQISLLPVLTMFLLYVLQIFP